MPGPLEAFLRMFQLLVGLHSRLHLFRIKSPFTPLIAGKTENPQVPLKRDLQVESIIPTRSCQKFSKQVCLWGLAQSIGIIFMIQIAEAI